MGKTAQDNYKMEGVLQILVIIVVFSIAHSISVASDDSSTNDVSVKRDDSEIDAVSVKQEDSEIYDGPYYSDDYLHTFGNAKGSIHTYINGVARNDKYDRKQWLKLLKAITRLHGKSKPKKRKGKKKRKE